MVPVILFEELSIGDSIKRSGEIFRKNWGEQVVSGFSLGLIFFLLAIPLVLRNIHRLCAFLCRDPSPNSEVSLRA